MSTPELTPETIRDHIAAQICPWCKAGPFRSLSKHTQRRHGITARHLRELAGLLRNTSICSPELASLKAEINRKLGLAPINGGAERARPDWSAAGLAAVRANFANATQQLQRPDVRARMTAGVQRRNRARRQQRGTCVVCGAQIADSAQPKNRTCASAPCKRELLSRSAKERHAIPGTVSVRDACRALGVSTTWAYDAIKRGDFPCEVRQVGKVIRVDEASLDALLSKKGTAHG